MLEGVTWADYERLLVVRGQRRMPRMAYLDGALEFISVHALRGRRYEVVARSGFLPDLDLAQLATFLVVKPTSRAIREYRAALSGG